MDLAIGELSKQTHVKVPTIRYYEQIGLLAKPLRTEGQQRRYGAAEVERLNFIRHARELGFEIDDIRELLALSAKPELACGEADAIAKRHLSAVEQRLELLNVLRAELQRMVRECRRGRIAECKIIQVLTDHSLCLSSHGNARPRNLARRGLARGK